MKYYVVDFQGLFIKSEHEDRLAALEAATKLGGRGKVMTKPRVGDLVLDPSKDSSWSPKRENPSPPKYRSPFICPACGGKGPGGASTVEHKPTCVFLKKPRRNPRLNPPLEDHVEFEPHRTVRSLRTRFGVEGVEKMLHDEDHDIDHDEDHDIERAGKASYMESHERGLRQNPDGGGSERGEKLYRMWHQKEPNGSERKRMGCDWDEKLVKVGKAHNIVYRSGKWEKRKKNDYIHHFDSKPSVYMRDGVVEGATGAGKTVEQLFGGLTNADGKVEVAELASVLSFALDDGGDGQDMELHKGAKVYGAVDKKTVLIVDPVWGPIVIKGGKMYFNERGIVL